MKLQHMLAGAVVALAVSNSATAAVVTTLSDAKSVSFAGAFESKVGASTRDYDGFTFKNNANNTNVWTSGPGYTFGAQGYFAGPVMALNAFSSDTFEFTFDSAVAGVLADFSWNPGNSSSPIAGPVISIYNAKGVLLETAQVGTKGFLGFAQRNAADIKRMTVTGSIFGVRDMSTTMTLATSAVPEPATWAMMITGFGLVGATVRRRRTALTLQAA